MNREQLRAQGLRRREALVLAGCSTYIKWFDEERMARSILCLCCGVRSYNQNDIDQLYCGVCAAWHSDWLVEP
jgi:hypothetical protein